MLVVVLLGFEVNGHELRAFLKYDVCELSHPLHLALLLCGIPMDLWRSAQAWRSQMCLQSHLYVSREGKEEIGRTRPFWTRVYRNPAQNALKVDAT